MRAKKGQPAARRKVTRNGKSLTVALPRQFLYTLSLARGHYLVLELFQEQRYFVIVPLVNVTPEDTRRWKIEGSPIAQRKVTGNGNSDHIAIPRYFLHALYTFQGDTLLLSLNEDRTAIIARPLTRRRIGPPAPRTMIGISQSAGE